MYSHLCEHCLIEWRNNYGINRYVYPWVHCHHDEPGPQPPKEEVKPPCKWCENWELYQRHNVYDMWCENWELYKMHNVYDVWFQAADYLITLGKYLQECPVCGARLKEVK